LRGLGWHSGIPFGNREGLGVTESIVSPEFQLISDAREGPSLYHWQEDPQESENLFLVPAYEAVSKELAAELKKNE